MTATAGLHMYQTYHILETSIMDTKQSNHGISDTLAFSFIKSALPDILKLDPKDIPDNIKPMILALSGKGDEDPDRRHFPINLATCNWTDLLGGHKALSDVVNYQPLF